MWPCLRSPIHRELVVPPPETLVWLILIPHTDGAAAHPAYVSGAGVSGCGHGRDAPQDVRIQALHSLPHATPRNANHDLLWNWKLPSTLVLCCLSHPVLEGKPNANHVSARIRNSRTQRLHNWTSSNIAQNNSRIKYFITPRCPRHP
jgi:hypothetical protein